jgi:3-hydroxyacyl-[acyl-carrier protein] dehydratase/trans-2-decenoyl-[acyl-carrier protein] isomerase
MSAALQSPTGYTRAELVALAEKGGLPRALLMPFHEVRLVRWDETSGTGRIEAVRKNRFDDWFYGCHFLGDPVMPGCWGLDGVWQALRLFASWRGLTGCDKPLGMEGVSFFGQIRPYDKEVVYSVDVLSIERRSAPRSGKATARPSPRFRPRRARLCARR